MEKVFYIFLIAIGISLNSCAVLFNRNPYLVKIDSYPDSAKVIINDSLIGITPFEQKLDEKQDTFKVRIKKDGFKEFSYLIKSDQNRFYALSDMLSLYGVFISRLAGYNYKELTPSNSYYYLEPDSFNIKEITKVKNNFNSNFITFNITPIYGILALILGTGVNYQKDLITISDNDYSRYNLGIKAGWGWGIAGGMAGGIEGFGYDLMPSFSYDKFDFNSNSNFSRYVFSIGASYQRIIRYSVFKGEPDKIIEKYIPSFNYQKINFYSNSNFFWGYSFGYVNAVNLISIDFGISF